MWCHMNLILVAQAVSRPGAYLRYPVKIRTYASIAVTVLGIQTFQEALERKGFQRWQSSLLLPLTSSQWPLPRQLAFLCWKARHVAHDHSAIFTPG